nr:MAG TPA: hypothetical protein [Caudoviricetes sp.]
MSGRKTPPAQKDDHRLLRGHRRHLGHPPGTNSRNSTANLACQVLSYTKPTQITTIILNLTKKDTGRCSSLSSLQMSFF